MGEFKWLASEMEGAVIIDQTIALIVGSFIIIERDTEEGLTCTTEIIPLGWQ